MKENIFIKDKLKKISIANYLKKKLKSAGFIDVDILKTSFHTRVIIYALKPGFIIGKKGSNIRALTDDLEKEFGFNKVHIEIGEIPNKNLDPKVIMESIQSNIARGMTWKSVVYGALRQIKEAGAIGAEIIAKGNTSGKGQRKRKSRFFFGYLKKAGDQKDLVSIEKRTTFPSLGTIGITLRIVNPNVLFSDKVDVSALAKDFKIRMEEEELEKTKVSAEKSDDKKVIKEKSDEKKTDDKKVIKEKSDEKKTDDKKVIKEKSDEKKTDDKKVIKEKLEKKIIKEKTSSETEEATK
ncbi:30S ribosomal protein S3 [archaeon]|nr:30S ribosomal protein S3 [archaeon]MDD2477576.1 30S ribosomal protein S3 [Candidatus ainarchaeum sp.]MDD3084328.1 30S ribosomal protein S3 [Candidatus ainarchaeum sp.]MDD4221070.1 30S ribosomal protein S3 [Candidatus ainarchaeum sp.]